MKAMRSFAFLKMLILAVALAAVAPAVAHAQSEVHGTFTLSDATHWGSVVLPAGSYDFRLDASAYPERATVRNAGGTPVAIVLAASGSPVQSSGESHLGITRVNGEVFISSLYIRGLDRELKYLVPKDTTMAMAKTAKARPLGTPSSAK